MSEVKADQVLEDLVRVRGDGGALEGPHPLGRPSVLGHDGRHGAHGNVDAGGGEFVVNHAVAEDPVRGIKHGLHLTGQLLMPVGRRGFLVILPPVIRGPGHAELLAHPLHREVGALLLNKAIEVFYRCSLAKNAETFFRNSFSRSISRSLASSALYLAASTGSPDLTEASG